MDSDQRVHSRTLISIFAKRVKKPGQLPIAINILIERQAMNDQTARLCMLIGVFVRAHDLMSCSGSCLIKLIKKSLFTLMTRQIVKLLKRTVRIAKTQFKLHIRAV